MKPKILVTGGNGRFAKVLKFKNTKLNLIFKSRKELDILKYNTLEKLKKLNQNYTPYLVYLVQWMNMIKISQKVLI